MKCNGYCLRESVDECASLGCALDWETQFLEWWDIHVTKIPVGSDRIAYDCARESWKKARGLS